ncbi:MAG: hypothetical protein Q4G71_02635 [Pseudomonadota bacterium]|nr:hypothetical protein [Pseudomonadota bacterium]
MKTIAIRTMLACATLAASVAAAAQNAPGSDPIMIGGGVSYLQLPGAPMQASGQIDSHTELPAWLQAKVTRYEIKAFNELDGGNGTVYTQRDVVSRQTGNALQRNCVTDVASNTYTGGAAAAGPAGRYGPGTTPDQMVVLRGDLVTICR